jgi:hypothetical protein
MVFTLLYGLNREIRTRRNGELLRSRPAGRSFASQIGFRVSPLLIPTPTRKPVFLLHPVDAEVLPFCLRLTTF